MAKIPPEMSFNWEFIEQNELNWFSIFQLIPSIQKFKALDDFFKVIKSGNKPYHFHCHL